MKKTRKPKTTQPIIEELPSNNLDMELYINQNRDRLMRSVVDNIEFAINNNQPSAEPFQFDNLPYVVLISQRDFRENLEHIFEVSISREQFETCAKIKSLLERLSKPRYIKQYKNVNLLQ